MLIVATGHVCGIREPSDRIQRATPSVRVGLASCLVEYEIGAAPEQGGDGDSLLTGPCLQAARLLFGELGLHAQHAITVSILMAYGHRASTPGRPAT